MDISHFCGAQLQAKCTLFEKGMLKMNFASYGTDTGSLQFNSTHKIKVQMYVLYTK